MEDKHLRSPQLRRVLEQRVRAGVFSSSGADELFQIFLDSVGAEGAVEIGYERPAGQSFNPRAARVALILIEDCGLTDPEPIRVALRAAARGREYREYLEPGSNDTVSRGEVAGAFLLDRLRHLHLETCSEPELVLGRCQKVSEELRARAPKLALLLEKGIERIRRLKIGDASRS